MKKFFLSLTALSLAVTTVGYVSAAFTDSAKAATNIFQAGTLNLQLSTTDSDANGVADTAVGWTENTSNVWVSPTNWTPGGTFTDTLFIRNAGTVDAETVTWTMSNIIRTGGANMDNAVNLTAARYDRDADGAADAGEDILATLVTTYGGGDGVLTLAELYTGLTVTPFNLESGASVVLPGNVTSPTIGGTNGTGKALVLTWTFDANASNAYQGASVTVDFDFNASNL